MPLFRALYNFARWLTHDASEAEDLVQETYARALKSYRTFRPGTNFKAWMFRILRNVFLTSRSRSKSAAHVPFEDEEGEQIALPAVTQDPETLLIAGSTRNQLQAALERLPPKYREVILLCDVEEMRYQEIAALIEVPVGTVMSRISRARRLLRGMLAEERLKV